MACFRNPAFDNDHNRTPPIDERSALWAMTGLIDDHLGCAAVGPRLMCTAGHLAPQITPGVNFINYGGQRYEIVEKHMGLGDACYLVIDRNIVGSYAKLWTGEPYSINNNVFIVHGVGFGRGAEIIENSILVGWYPGDATTAHQRWSMGKLNRYDWNLAPANAQWACYFENPASEVAWSFIGNSGSPGWIDAGLGTGVNRWVFIGPVTSTASTDWAKFDATYSGTIGCCSFQERVLIDQLNGTFQSITIDQPVHGFDMAGSFILVEGSTVGELVEVYVRMNDRTERAGVVNNYWSLLVPVPLSPDPIPVWLDAFDQPTFDGSTIFSNSVQGEAVNRPLITIMTPPTDFSQSSPILHIAGSTTGGLSHVTVRVNGVLYRTPVNQVSLTFVWDISLPPATVITEVEIDAFDDVDAASSSVFSNTVYGVITPAPPTPPPTDPPKIPALGGTRSTGIKYPTAEQAWLFGRRTRSMYPPTTPVPETTYATMPPVIATVSDMPCLLVEVDNFYQMALRSGTNTSICPLSWYIAQDPIPPDWVEIDQRSGLMTMHPPASFLTTASWRVRAENCRGSQEVDIHVNACVSTYTVYLGNDSETKRTVYVAADVTGTINDFGNTRPADSPYGVYEILDPPGGMNYYRIMAWPDLALVGKPLVWYSPSEFKISFELVQSGLDINGVAYSIYRTGVRSAGPFDMAHGTEITVSPS